MRGSARTRETAHYDNEHEPAETADASDPNSIRNDEESSHSNSKSWYTSPERLKARTLYLTFTSLGLIALYMGGLFFAVWWMKPNELWKRDLPPTQGLYIATIFVLLGLAGAVFGVTRLSSARGKFYERIESEARGQLSKAIDELQDVNDLAALMRANRKQIDAYDIIARSQAANSYRSSQIAMFAGLVILGVGVVIALFGVSSSTKYSAAFLSATGTVVGAYIARTFLSVHEKAVRQMEFYFRQPLVHSYVLTAQRIAEKIGEPKRGEKLSTIVDQLVTSTILGEQNRSNAPDRHRFRQRNRDTAERD